MFQRLLGIQNHPCWCSRLMMALFLDAFVPSWCFSSSSVLQCVVIVNRLDALSWYASVPLLFLSCKCLLLGFVASSPLWLMCFRFACCMRLIALSTWNQHPRHALSWAGVQLQAPVAVYTFSRVCSQHVQLSSYGLTFVTIYTSGFIMLWQYMYGHDPVCLCASSLVPWGMH